MGVWGNDLQSFYMIYLLTDFEWGNSIVDLNDIYSFLLAVVKVAYSGIVHEKTLANSLRSVELVGIL